MLWTKNWMPPAHLLPINDATGDPIIRPVFDSRIKSISLKDFLHFPKQQILDSSNLKEFADENINLMKMVERFSKWLENTVGKGKIAHYEQFLLYPKCFQDQGLFGKGVKVRIVWYRFTT